MTYTPCYQPLPVTFTHGQGVFLYDTDKREYMDGVAGIAVCGLGHAHPDITHTIATQASKLIHVSNGYHIKEQATLAQTLLAIADMKEIFFSNSGAEANEAAIKIARQFGHAKNIENPTLIVLERAFHGRTMATLSASGSRKVQAGFEPLVPGFIRAPFNDIEAIRHIATHRDDIVGIMLEPIQGEGGIHIAHDDYLFEVQSLCKANDWLFILDEIQTGNGRTGQFFYYQHLGLSPDIVTTAKGLGNGFPIGATLMNHLALNRLKPGSHGSTFGGNPLASMVALTVIHTLKKHHIIENAHKMGILLKNALREQLEKVKGVKSIRGKGLMIGIELDRPAQDARQIGLAHQVLFNVTSDTVIRLLPPLIINEQEIWLLADRVSTSIKLFLNG
jgi:acetylornithine/N-succinyldiaminopimelate aminotransferase